MSDIKIRLREILGPNVSKFARMIGEKRQNIDNYLKGRMPRAAFLIKLAQKKNININWLLTGKGAKEYPAASAANIITDAQYKELLKNQIHAKVCICIPIISEAVASGDPLIVKEKDIEGFVGLPKTWLKLGHSYCCLGAPDNRMHPIISQGFMVAIDLTENDPLKLARQMVAARYQDGVIIKYLLLTERDYILTPHNLTEYKPVAIVRTAPNPIIGQVAWWWGQPK